MLLISHPYMFLKGESMKIFLSVFLFAVVIISTQNMMSYSSASGVLEGYSNQPQSLTSGAGGGGGFHINIAGTTNGAGGGGN